MSPDKLSSALFSHRWRLAVGALLWLGVWACLNPETDDFPTADGSGGSADSAGNAPVPGAQGGSNAFGGGSGGASAGGNAASGAAGSGAAGAAGSAGMEAPPDGGVPDAGTADAGVGSDGG